MSDVDAVAAALVGLRLRERELELDACAIRARVEEIRDLIGLLEHGTRRRRGTRRATVLEMPDRVTGGTAGAEAGLPSLDEARGILKIPEDAA